MTGWGAARQAAEIGAAILPARSVRLTDIALEMAERAGLPNVGFSENEGHGLTSL
jgi:formate dehydrogenase assembly factor FdhD